MGSLAYKLEDGVQAVLTAGGLPQLLRQLSCEDERVVEAAVRCLHFLLQVGHTCWLGHFTLRDQLPSGSPLLWKLAACCRRCA